MLNFGLTCATIVTENIVREWEALGVDSLWVAGHVTSPSPLPEAMTQLSRLVAYSKRARVGTAVLLLPLYPPAIIARQIADFDNYCNGRLNLGVGIGGEFEEEFRACGISIRERGKRTDEAISLIRRLWTAEEVTHDGPFYPMQKVRIRPAPVQVGGPPIIVAGRQEPAMRRAAMLGNGWMPYLFSPRRYAESVALIRRHAEDEERNLDRFQWMLSLFINICDDASQARRETIEFLGDTYNQDFAPLLNRVTASGTPEYVIGRLQEFIDAGVRHFVFVPATNNPDIVGMTRRLMREVVPQLSCCHK